MTRCDPANIIGVYLHEGVSLIFYRILCGYFNCPFIDEKRGWCSIFITLALLGCSTYLIRG